MNERSNKVYVGVTALFTPEGQLLPRTIHWENGQPYPIDRVVQIRRAASLKAGGAGIRYTVEIHGRQTYLFLEEDRWFVERK